MLELMTAIKTKAMADADLTGLIGSDLYFGFASAEASAPWVVVDIVSGLPIRTFRAADDAMDVEVQFTVFDNSNQPNTAQQIASDIDLAFDRQTLVYSSHQHIGCIKIREVGPVRLEDVWQKIVDYRITFSYN